MVSPSVMENFNLKVRLKCGSHGNVLEVTALSAYNQLEHAKINLPVDNHGEGWEAMAKGWLTC